MRLDSHTKRSMVMGEEKGHMLGFFHVSPQTHDALVASVIPSQFFLIFVKKAVRTTKCCKYKGNLLFFFGQIPRASKRERYLVCGTVVDGAR